MLKEGEIMYHNLFRIILLVAAIAIILAACATPTSTLAPATESPIATEPVTVATEIALMNTPEPTGGNNQDRTINVTESFLGHVFV